LQRRVELATRELNERRLDAERANQAKTRFLAAASHDLRQPLHALGLFADQLSRRKLVGEDQRLVARIVESTEALSELLDALLDISRLDAGAYAPKVRPFPLAPLLGRIRQEYEELAKAKGLRLKVVESDRWIESDPAMFERILINLMSNAIRYTDRGSVMLAVRRRGNRLRIEVRDSGIGVPESSQELIFSEFVQLGNPERDRRKGLGLGLSILQRMCALLAHPYGLRSRPAGGSVFWVEVPQATPVRDITPDAAPAEGELTGRTVAVVEDDPLALEGLRGQLQAWGCEVYGAPSGAELMVQLARHGARPDLIVSDQQLPNGEYGLLVIDQLRDRYGRGIPALLVTGHPSQALQAAAAELRLPILSKPVRPAKLRAVVQGLLVQGLGNEH
jgi:CheY-like chemotaxis protein